MDLALGKKFNYPINNLLIINNLINIEFRHMYQYSIKDIKFTNLHMIKIGNNNVLNTFVFPHYFIKIFLA